MQIRLIQETEIWNALNLCYQRSMDLVWEMAVRMPEPDVFRIEREKYYQKKLKYELHLERIKSGGAVVFGAFENQELCGMAELNTGNAQIYCMAVKKGLKEADVRRQLLFEMACYAKSRIQRQSFLVEAEPEEAKFYGQLGFAGNPQQIPGTLLYLYRNVDQILAGGRPKKKRTGLWIGLGVGSVLLVFLAAVLLGRFAFREIRTEMTQRRVYPDGNNKAQEEPFDTPHDGNGDYWYDDGTDDNRDDWYDEETEDDTVMSIEEYVAADVTYEIEEQQYQEQSDTGSRFYIYFDIQYPEITGLSPDVQGKVNQIIKEYAMQTQETYYANPSEKIKEWMLRQQQPVVMSQVRYKVSYMTNDLICVIFEDNYVAGNMNQTKLDMRAVTIHVKDGTVYTAGDVLDLNKEFAKMWRASVIDNYGDQHLLKDFKESEIVKMFQGEYEDEGIRTEMILTADGIEIGFHYDYTDTDDEIANGYLTMDFDKEELKDYQKSAAFWNMVKDDK